MADKDYSYSEAKARLDEIVAEVRRKDVSLEKSLDLLEEAGRLASHCTDLIDQADSVAFIDGDAPEGVASSDGSDGSDSVPAVDGTAAAAGE